MTSKEIIKKTPWGNVVFKLEENIIIRLSGGFDSATLLYTLCDIIEKEPDPTYYKIIPITVTKVGNKYNDPKKNKANLFLTSDNVIKHAKKRYPLVHIVDSEKLEIHEWWKDSTLYTKRQQDLIDKVTKSFKNNNWIEYNGVTKNPDIDISPFEKNPELHRQKKLVRGAIKDTVSVHFPFCNAIEPFRNADKRIVFSLAKQHNVLDELLEISRSCEGGSGATNNFTIDCKDGPYSDEYVCWWCVEREWALKNYDI